MKRAAIFYLLIPLRDNMGTRFSAADHDIVQEFLIEKYGGITIQHNPQHPLMGRCLSPSRNVVDRDELMMLGVATEDINEARKFFSSYKHELEKKFQQEEIMIWEQTVEVL